MKKILFLFLIIFNFHAFAQTMEQKDSLVNEICKTIIASNNYPDSLQLGIAFQKHLFPFMAKYPEDKKRKSGKVFTSACNVTAKSLKPLLIKWNHNKEIGNNSRKFQKQN